ncbi:MAG: hypothetical protein ACSHXB_09500 [Sulfitobacter sp.]
MSAEHHMRLYLEQPLRKSAEAGEHNFINLILEVLNKSLFRVEFCDISEMDSGYDGYSLSHMKEPPNQRGLVFRRVYQYPFWQIEQTNMRWHWDVAQACFNDDIAAPDAARFYEFWQKRIFGDATNQSEIAESVYIPLQGRLTQHRSFQACSPIEMIEHCLEQDQGRRIIATLHPNENYSVQELAKLDALVRQHSRLSIGSGSMMQHLRACDYVVTQNSSAAFAGYFFGKPALLFGKIDFHHIAEKVDTENLAHSFENVANLQPNYAKYIWWFWQQQSINAGRSDARDKISARFKRFGWPIS